MYIKYMKQISSPGLMHETERSGLVHWNDPEGWDGEGGGRGVQDGEHMYTHGFALMHSAWISVSKDLWLQAIETSVNRKECVEGLWCGASNMGKVRHVIGKNRK